MGCRYPVLVVAIDRSIGQVFTEVYILERSTSPAYISAQATTYFWPTRLPQAHLPSTSPQYFQSVLRDRNGIRAPLKPITPTHLSSSSSVDTSWCESPGKCWRVIHPISVMWTYLPSVTATTPLCIAAMVWLGTRSSPQKISKDWPDRKSTRLNSSHSQISYAVFCLKKKRNAEPRAVCQLNFGSEPLPGLALMRRAAR